jgi:hypothetical protein
LRITLPVTNAALEPLAKAFSDSARKAALEARRAKAKDKAADAEASQRRAEFKVIENDQPKPGDWDQSWQAGESGGAFGKRKEAANKRKGAKDLKDLMEVRQEPTDFQRPDKSEYNVPATKTLPVETVLKDGTRVYSEHWYSYGKNRDSNMRARWELHPQPGGLWELRHQYVDEDGDLMENLPVRNPKALSTTVEPFTSLEQARSWVAKWAWGPGHYHKNTFGDPRKLKDKARWRPKPW